MTELQVKTNHGMGWRPDLPDYRDLKFAAAMPMEAVEFKPSVIISRTNLPPVWDQLQTSSCVGQAGSTMMTYVKKVRPRSRLQLYYEARRLIGETDRDEGCYIRDAIKVMANLGVGREELWRFKPENVTIDPPIKVDRDALQRKIFKYARLSSREDILKCLSEKMPFVIGLSLYNSFMSREVAKLGIVSLPQGGESLIGGHAVTGIGYDLNFKESQWAKEAIAAGYSPDKIPKEVIIFRNSWSERWGRKGDFACDLNYVCNSNLAADGWTIRNR